MKKKHYYILVYPWAVYVKEAHYFESQGGTTAEWGKRWKKIEAGSLADAHKIALNRAQGQSLTT